MFSQFIVFTYMGVSIMNSLLRQLFLIFAFGLLAFPGQSFALCAAQDMAGDWVNKDSQTRGITKLNINFACNDTVLNGVPSNDPDTVQAWGSCSPTDCKWEPNILINRFWDGRKTQYTYAEVVYKKSFATVTLKLYLLDENHLQVISLTDFKDSGKPDYSAIEYFRK